MSMEMTKERIYELRKYGVLVGTGTLEELSKVSNLSLSTITTLASRPTHKWRLHKSNQTKTESQASLKEVNTKLVRERMIEVQVSITDMAEDMNLTATQLGRKLIGLNHFSDSQINILCDLLFLEEGDLVLEEE